MADLCIWIITGRTAQRGQQWQHLGIRNWRKSNHAEMFGSNFVLTSPRQNLEKCACACGSLARGRPRVTQKIDGFIGQAKTFLDKPGRAENVILREAVVHNSANRAGRRRVITEPLVQFGGFQPASMFFIAFNRFEQQAAFSEAAGGFERIVELLFVDERGFAEKLSAFQRVSGGNKVAEQFSVDV